MLASDFSSWEPNCTHNASSTSATQKRLEVCMGGEHRGPSFISLYAKYAYIFEKQTNLLLSWRICILI